LCLRSFEPTVRMELTAAAFRPLNSTLTVGLFTSLLAWLSSPKRPLGVVEDAANIASQLELLELEPGVSTAEVQAESERPALQPSTKTKRQHPGRQELPANLPRVERILARPSNASAKAA
jgi:hypothetical protein